MLKIGRLGFNSLAESGQKTLKVGIHNTGVGIRSQGGTVAPWIFIDSADKLEGGLMVLFFGLVFTGGPP